ncbi:MAG: hypothetical protein NTZ49_05670 [Candidatus Parcubacteria bacterium]|nr:hypothetical protein [Candidatus Parcubacteria bacterium]
MLKIKFAFMLLAVSMLIMGCNLKVNLNSNLNQSSVQVEPGDNENVNKINEVPAAVNGLPGSNQQVDFTFDLTPENMINKVLLKSTGEIYIDDITRLCGAEVMIYAHPENSMKVILTKLNPGSDKPISSLYLLYLQDKTCKKLDVSKELTDFGAFILSPDQTKLAVALETNEAKELKLLNLIEDQARTLITLGEKETLNGGYGALSNHFDIKWLDNQKIQYTVYEESVKNYQKNSPETLEKVNEVRIVDITK